MIVVQRRIPVLLFVLFTTYLSSWTTESAHWVARYSKDDNEGKIYLLNKGWAREITDSKSVERLGFSIDSLENISGSMLSLFRLGHAADHPPIYPYNNNLDELTRAEIAMIDALQTPLLYGMRKLGEYINPGVIPWKGRLFLASGLAWGFTEGGKSANEKTEFQWVNNTYFPFHSSEDYLGISTKINPLNQELVGQDPRFIQVDENRLFVAYTNRFGHVVRMGMAEVVLNTDTGITSLENVHGTINPPEGHRGDEKNWSPFLYNGTVLMIQSINPLHVVQLDDYSHTNGDPGGYGNSIDSHTVSLAEEVPVFFHHGHLRGGTNAILVGDVYLSLFHTAFHVPGNFLKSYWMGAYTFSAQPPFKLLSVSPYPIVSKRMKEE
jgi:hypothetical protein